MNKDARSLFASRWELEEYSHDGPMPGLGLAAAGAGLGVGGALIVSHLMAGLLDCDARRQLYPSAARCASIQSLHSTPNDFVALLETCI
jgi:hypothetical protein